jgi:hypothetical protein
VRGHDILLSPLLPEQFWAYDVRDVPIVEIVLWLVYYKRSSGVAKEKWKHRHAALPCGQVLDGYETAGANR